VPAVDSFLYSDKVLKRFLRGFVSTRTGLSRRKFVEQIYLSRV
jgi:hypothetical protein